MSKEELQKLYTDRKGFVFNGSNTTETFNKMLNSLIPKYTTENPEVIAEVTPTCKVVIYKEDSNLNMPLLFQTAENGERIFGPHFQTLREFFIN